MQMFLELKMRLYVLKLSGTHAISTALFSILRPNDELLYITGSPYDTLEEVIGKRGNSSGSLKDLGVSYNEVKLTEEGMVDYQAEKEKIKDRKRTRLNSSHVANS